MPELGLGESSKEGALVVSPASWGSSGLSYRQAKGRRASGEEELSEGPI